MKKSATAKSRREARWWDDIRALYDQVLHWYYEEDNPDEAKVYAHKLEPLLQKASPHHETILGEECWSMIHQLNGNYPDAIRYRENEIRLIERLHELANGKPNGQAILARYDYADLCDRLELLANLYHQAGNLDKAVTVLQECEHLCEKHKLAFDGQDMLEAYLAEIADGNEKGRGVHKDKAVSSDDPAEGEKACVGKTLPKPGERMKNGMSLRGMLSRNGEDQSHRVAVFGWLNLGIVESLTNGLISALDAVRIFYNADNCLFVRKHLRSKTADEIMSRGVQLADLFDVLPADESHRQFQRELSRIRSLCLTLLEQKQVVAQLADIDLRIMLVHDGMMPSFDWAPAYDNKFFLGTACALVAVLLLARRFARSPTARSWPLLLIRGTALAVLLLLLLNPVRISETRVPPKPAEVVCLVDCSRSMALDQPFSRLDQMKQALAGSKRLLPADAAAHISLYRFGQDLLALQSVDELHADDDATRLHESLEHLLSRFETLPASVVVFSDGRITESGDAIEVAAAYRRVKVPIHVFPVGDANAAGDVAIQDVIAPRDAAPGSRVLVRVLTRSHGFADRRAEVRIRSLTDPRRPPLAMLPIMLKEGQQDHQLTMTHEPAAGQLVVEVPPLEGEATEANNRVPFQIGARKGKIRVLYMEGTVSPPAEYRYIQDALQEDPNIECVCMEVNNQLADKPILFHVNNPGRGFPTTRAELFSYDVIICSDIARAAFTQQQLDWTAELVAERGGGFVMIGGFTSFGSGKWNQTVWDGLVPIEMGGRDGYYHNETFRVRVPPQAERHPIWRIVDDPAKNRQILDQMPQFYGTNQGDRLKPAATLLGLSDRPIGGSAIMPIFSCEPFGRGRTFAMLTDSTVGWGQDFERLWGESDNRYFRKFWRNVIYWLVENSAKGNRRLRIDTDKIIYHPGEPIKITAQAYDDRLEATTQYKLLARLRPVAHAGQPLGSSLQEGTLAARETDRTYQGELNTPSLRQFPAPAGNEASPLRTAVLEVVAYDGEQVAAQTVLDAQILDDPVEFRDPRPDPEKLEELARLTGGKVLHTAEELAQELKNKSAAEGEVIVNRAPMWDHPWLWLLLVGLLTVEWIWRRWSGLA